MGPSRRQRRRPARGARREPGRTEAVAKRLARRELVAAVRSAGRPCLGGARRRDEDAGCRPIPQKSRSGGRTGSLRPRRTGLRGNWVGRCLPQIGGQSPPRTSAISIERGSRERGPHPRASPAVRGLDTDTCRWDARSAARLPAGSGGQAFGVSRGADRRRCRPAPVRRDRQQPIPASHGRRRCPLRHPPDRKRDDRTAVRELCASPR